MAILFSSHFTNTLPYRVVNTAVHRWFYFTNGVCDSGPTKWTIVKIRLPTNNSLHQSAPLYRYSTVPYSTASKKMPSKLKIQYSTQYSSNWETDFQKLLKHDKVRVLFYSKNGIFLGVFIGDTFLVNCRKLTLPQCQSINISYGTMEHSG